MNTRPVEAPLLDRVKGYASSVMVTTTPWLNLLMNDIIVELERLRQIDAAQDAAHSAGQRPTDPHSPGSQRGGE